MAQGAALERELTRTYKQRQLYDPPDPDMANTNCCCVTVSNESELVKTHPVAAGTARAQPRYDQSVVSDVVRQVDLVAAVLNT